MSNEEKQEVETSTTETAEAVEEKAGTEESAQTDEAGTEEESKTDWTAEAKKWEARSKANYERAQEADQLETKVTELEEALKQANSKFSDSELEITRWKVAAEHGLSTEDAELFLTGSDEETLTKQAERLSQSSHRAPKPDLAQGNRSQEQALTTKEQGASAVAQLF